MKSKRHRIIKIKVKTPHKFFIVEEINNNFIEKGSRIYCGCCGGIIAVCDSYLQFPFSFAKLDSVLVEKNYDHNVFGVRHRMCGNILPSIPYGYKFIDVVNYFKSIKEENEIKIKRLAVDPVQRN